MTASTTPRRTISHRAAAPRPPTIAALAQAFNGLGLVELLRGHAQRAEPFLRDSAALCLELGHDAGVWFPLMNLAAVAQMYGDLVRAATLFGTVEALRLRQGAVVPPEQARIDERLRTLRGQLSERRILGRSRMGGA